MLPIDNKVKSLITGALIAGTIGLAVYFLPKSKNAIESNILTKIKRKQRRAGAYMKNIAAKKTVPAEPEVKAKRKYVKKHSPKSKTKN